MTMNIIETKPVRLKGINIWEVSAVDVAANPMASITITKRGTPSDAVPVYVTKDVLQPANGKSPNLGVLKSQPERSEGYMDEISKGAAAEATLDVLVLKRQEQYPDESEATAMTKILATKAGQQAYAAMVYGKDLEVAKSSTLLTYGNRTDIKKVGSSSADTQPAASDPWSRLDAMAKQHSVSHGTPFHQSYAAIIGTPAGQKLYAAGLKTGAAA
jgi:hypothetical protein